MAGNIPGQRGARCDFVNLKIHRFSLSDMLIGIGCARVHKGDYVCVTGTCFFIMLLKNKNFKFEYTSTRGKALLGKRTQSIEGYRA